MLTLADLFIENKEIKQLKEEYLERLSSSSELIFYKANFKYAYMLRKIFAISPRVINLTIKVVDNKPLFECEFEDGITLEKSSFLYILSPLYYDRRLDLLKLVYIEGQIKIALENNKQVDLSEIEIPEIG